MISVKKQGPYEVFSRGVEEPWAVWRDGRPYRQVWTWKEVDTILAGESTKRGRDDHAVMKSEAASARYRVAYLVPNPRRGEPGEATMLRLWYAGADHLQTMTEALTDLRAARRRGYTAWVTDAEGHHVPVKGAMRPYRGTYSA